MSNEPRLDPKIERMLEAQKAAGICISILAAIAAYFWIVVPMGLHFLPMLLAIIVAFFITRVGNAAAVSFFQVWFYKGDWKALEQDALQANAWFKLEADQAKRHVWGDMDAKYVVMEKSDRFGSFMDEPLYDWIKIMGRDGRQYRFEYHGTRDLRQKTLKPIPKDCIMYAPGIIYQVENPINTTA